MKQKKFGRKVQNWHRPLGPSRLRRRFLQHRHDQPEQLVAPGGSLDYYAEVDACWDCFDPRPGSYRGHPNELFSFHLDHLWHALAGPLVPHIDLDRWAGGTAERPAENAIPAPTADPTNAGEIEDRLAAYVLRLVHLSAQDSLVLRYRIAQALDTPQSLEIVTSEYAHAPAAAQRICLFAPFWKRRPHTWKKESGIPLLDHLFVLYPVPRFLYPEWFRDLYPGMGTYYAHDYADAEEAGGMEEAMPGFKWLCWFLVLAQGGSLKRAGELFDWRVSPRLAHGLQQAPAEASPVEACVFAEVLRLGGTEIDAARVLGNPAFVIDPTEFSATGSHWDFWQDTVRWLSAHRAALTDEQSQQILSWAMHEYTEAERRRGQRDWQPYTWKGRRVRGVLERSAAYHRQIARPYLDYAWCSHHWDWVLDEGAPGQWTFAELTSGAELFREGQAMHHCVASYAGRCAAGHAAIVSLSHEGVRRVTVEINPRTRQIVQARGACNRSADPAEQRAIHLWLKTIVRPGAAGSAE
ncbi:MAG: PcfJ domain-containing protein [Planctomycetes bacterium]|jgi:hypothetical protein|nr:PcfJ domain-containing protein [Planctomycetota bacterium]